MEWMKSAGGVCTSNGRGAYNCTNVDPARFKESALCGK
jgi:hypothetical protein